MEWQPMDSAPKDGTNIILYNGSVSVGHYDSQYQEWVKETHEVGNCWRYYGPGYERGPWPLIAATLMTLMASEDVETVWYFGDNSDSDDPFTIERLEQYNKHYIENGDRPYRDFFKNFQTTV